MTKCTHRVLLLAFTIGFTACDGRSPSEPTPLPPASPSGPSAPSVTAIEKPFAVTVTPSTGAVDAGGRMSVSWTAPRAQPKDWLALFRVGEGYDDDWWDYTNGATSGTLTLAAPTRPGQYEFRYLSDDSFLDLARSSPVTVR
jgi:hypothetical protein